MLDIWGTFEKEMKNAEMRYWGRIQENAKANSECFGGQRQWLIKLM